MKKTMLITAFASAIALFGGAATADVTGRTVVKTFEFYAIGHGDATGVCINQPTPPPPWAAVGSCVEADPIDPNTSGGAQEDFVTINVVDSAGTPVYFTVQQAGGAFGWGCGTVTSHPVHPGHPTEGGAFPVNGSGPGGSAPEPVVVFPWAGPGIHTALAPGGTLCAGSVDTALVEPGTVGTVTFIFHDEVAGSIPPSATPVDLVTEFRAAMAESAADSQAYNSTNVSSGNGASCSITPYDATAGSFRGAGFGTEQMRIKNVLVEAGNFALFQVECFGQDTNAFTTNADYWFEYRIAPNDWRPVGPVGTEFDCGAASRPGGGVRAQAAAFTVPGLDPDCDFEQFYRENDPVLTKPHRLHVHLTTTNGVDMHGISLPWPSRIVTSL